MGLRDKFFGHREPREPVEIPPILQPENPVNYSSVLTWLEGLSEKDYLKMISVVETYRAANKDAAKHLGIKDEPTTELLPPPPTDEEVDEQLDGLLDMDNIEDAFIDDDAPTLSDPKKQQSPKETKIKISEKSK